MRSLSIRGLNSVSKLLAFIPPAHYTCSDNDVGKPRYLQEQLCSFSFFDKFTLYYI